MKKQIIGADIVKANGGKVVRVSVVPEVFDVANHPKNRKALSIRAWRVREFMP